jgi:hypothetical protein
MKCSSNCLTSCCKLLKLKELIKLLKKPAPPKFRVAPGFRVKSNDPERFTVVGYGLVIGCDLTTSEAIDSSFCAQRLENCIGLGSVGDEIERLGLFRAAHPQFQLLVGVLNFDSNESRQRGRPSGQSYLASGFPTT